LNKYEILIKTAYPYKEKTITSEEEIDFFMESIKMLHFTKPVFNRKKGWEADVTIKYKDSRDIKKEYRYFIRSNYIYRSIFRYKIVS
jgi:adenylosuccinate synthase